MRPGHFIAAVMTLLASGPVLCAAPAANGAPGEPIETATRQNAYTIPFRIDPPPTPVAQPVEVQLHVSTDQGANWSLSSRVRPEKGAFVFRAPHDGEYWYSIRTVDAQGITRPDGPLVPQLKVTVDTVAPRLDLSVAHGAAGEIVARWQAVDPNLKQGSFKLEYQATSSGPWQRVAVESTPSEMRHTLSGEATWWPTGGEGTILVRAEIIDRSGNPAVTQAVVKPAPVAGVGPVATRQAADDGWRGAAPADNGDTRWPPDRAVDSSLSGSSRRTAPAADPAARDVAPPSSAPAGFVPDEKARTSAQAVSNNRLGRPGSPLDFSVLPAAVRPRMVGTREFELEYEIESVGPSGVGRVELWGTRDGGQTWSDYAVDTDNHSPISVAVDGEGIYGFRILVQSGSGFGGQPPAEGDVPDIWIGVDTTKPSCRITGTEVSPDASELIVRWEATDDVLDPRPVTLLFSRSTAGPWTPIASGLENTGSYRWHLDSRVPERIVVRLEVRDEAGNVGIADTVDPVAVDRHRPQGKIRGVRPISHP